MKLFLTILGVCGLAQAQANLPGGPGKDLVENICTKCHGLDNITRSHFSKDRWSEEVDDMIDRGAEGTDDQFDRIEAYLAKNFGPVKVLVNTATSAELASALAIPDQAAQAIVEYRQKNGKFKKWTDLKNVPGLDMKKIEDNKDLLVF